MDSNTSLPSILTPEIVDAVSAIWFDSSDLAWINFSGRLLLQNCGRATFNTMFVTKETNCSVEKEYALPQGSGGACFKTEAYEICCWTTCCLKVCSL